MNERNAGTGPKRWVSAFFVPRHILFINLAYKKSGKRCYVCPFAWGFVDLKIFFNDFVVNRDHMVKCLDLFGAALFLKLGHSLGDIQDIIHLCALLTREPSAVTYR